MATFDQVRKKIAQLPENIKKHAPNIIAETATEYFKERFAVKAWEGVGWDQAKNPPDHGTLMVRSGALVSTIRPSQVTDNIVVISAGSARVPYPRIHNEGGTITQIPTPKQRKFFWAMEYKNKSETKTAQVEDSSDTNKKLGQWGAMAIAKQLTINIPKRQFMGHSPELNKRILERLKPLLNIK